MGKAFEVTMPRVGTQQDAETPQAVTKLYLMSGGGPWGGCGQSQVCSEAAYGGVVFNRLGAARAHMGKRCQGPSKQTLMVFPSLMQKDSHIFENST